MFLRFVARLGLLHLAEEHRKKKQGIDFKCCMSSDVHFDSPNPEFVKLPRAHKISMITKLLIASYLDCVTEPFSLSYCVALVLLVVSMVL